MKKNIFLFLILVALLVFTYLFQEKKFWSKEPKSLSHAIDFHYIDSITFKDGVVNLKPSPVIEGLNYPADEKAIHRFLTALAFIHPKKDIGYDAASYRNYFSPDAKRIKIRRSDLLEMEFILGEKVPGDEEFYWYERKGNESKIYIASFDEALKPGETQYVQEGDRYQHLEQLMDMGSLSFFLSDIFTPAEKEKIWSISVLENGKELFEIPWHKQTEMPHKHGLEWNQDKIDFCKDEILNMKATSIREGQERLSILAEMELKFRGGQKRKIRLLHDEKGEGGFFLEKDSNPLWYQLALGKESCLLMSEQDYIKKTLIFQKHAELKLIKGKNKFDVLIKNKTSTALFDLLFGKSPFNEADRISFAKKKDPITLLSGLNLEWGDLKLFLGQKKDEILLWNKNEGVILHYYLTPERQKAGLSLNMKDYSP